MDSLYTDLLLDLYHHPLNKQSLRDFDIHHKEHNPLCGDMVEVFIKLDEYARVKAVSWQGEGCAVSQAAASVITEEIKNKTKTQIESLTKEQILPMLGIEQLNPTRLRCALLSLQAIRAALQKK